MVTNNSNRERYFASTKQEEQSQMAIWTLDDWKSEIWDTFKNNDEKRWLPDIWGSVVYYSSVIAEGLRKAHYDEVLKGIAHTFVWMASFVAKLSYDPDIKQWEPFKDLLWKDELADINKEVFDDNKAEFASIIAYKYANQCGHCSSNPCDCARKLHELEKQKDKKIKHQKLAEARHKLFRKCKYYEWSLNTWIGMFDEIYRNSIRYTPLEIIGFHLAEEIGECMKAIRLLQHLEGLTTNGLQNLNQDKLENLCRQVLGEAPKIKPTVTDLHGAAIRDLKIEVADSFSWLCALFLRIRYILTSIQTPDEKRPRLKDKDEESIIKDIVILPGYSLVSNEPVDLNEARWKTWWNKVPQLYSGLHYEKEKIQDNSKEIWLEENFKFSDLLWQRFCGEVNGKGFGFICDDCGKRPCECTIGLVKRQPVKEEAKPAQAAEEDLHQGQGSPVDGAS